jgi:imidazolonepropionase-like amidohydrolase
MNLTKRTAALVAAVAVAFSPARSDAQLGSTNPLPGPQETVAIRGARIVPVSGPEIANGTIVINGGRITAVGANAAVPQGARVIDGTGLSVYPGMMDAGTQMGLGEIPQGANATMDNAEVGSFNPNAIAYFGMNPHSAHIGVTRVVGVTHVLSSPSGGVVSGQSTLANLAGWTPAAMSIRQRAALVVTLPRAGGFGGFGGGGFGGGGGGNQAGAARLREAQTDSLRQLIADARAYDVALRATAADRSLPRVVPDIKLDAMLPYVRRELPVIFDADRAVDIRAAVEFADANGLRAVINGGREASDVADLLKSKDVAVLYSNVRNLPTREDDAFDVNFAGPARLMAAGVRFAITSGDNGAEVRDLPYVAGMAAAYGLSKEDALRSITMWPAQIFGIGDQYGSLEVGKVANLVVVTGDLLEATTDTRYLFIDGRAVPLDTRHSQLWQIHKDRR